MSLNAKLTKAGIYPGFVFGEAPRNVYWEVTIACDLQCQHCRALSIKQRDPLELSTDEGKAMLRDVKSMGSMIVLTGGDPMKRPDLIELISYAREISLPLSITPSTTPTLTRATVEQFKELGVMAMGVSLDGHDAASHDAFRGVEGTFEHSMDALSWAGQYQLPVQVNTTVTSRTLDGLPKLYEVLRSRFSPPVKRWSLFMLVPVGRGEDLGMPTAEQVEELWGWVYDTAGDAPFHISSIEAPHYRRYWTQRKLAEGMQADELEKMAMRMGFGARDGNGIIFVSHRGEVYPAGFLPHPKLGDVRQQLLSSIYRDSPHLHRLRDMDQLLGRCGRCEFRWLCGGSRARAYATTGDLMESDPSCLYEPGA
jgi:radical SAM protein